MATGLHLNAEKGRGPYLLYRWTVAMFKIKKT
jgi:hypothetical protein